MTLQARSLALAVTANLVIASLLTSSAFAANAWKGNHVTFGGGRHSARSSTTGTVTFCVSGMALGGYTYQAGTNRESCSSIVK